MEQVQPTPLRISTKVITANVGATLSLKKLFQNIHTILIPLGWPGEGILKMEGEKEVIGYSNRDRFSKRHVSEKTFFNQSTIVVRRAMNAAKTEFKEVNVKLFGNGGIQMTGIPAEEFAQSTLEWMIQELKRIPADIFETEPQLQKFKVQLINSDQQVKQPILRTQLHHILTKQQGLFSTFESTIYQGVNTKYYYNDQHPDKLRPGICLCSKRCRGQGTGSGPGQCKRITMSVFQTGKIIITGARQMQQLEEAQNFLNAVLGKHAEEVLRLPTPSEEAAAAAAAATQPPAKVRVKRTKKTAAKVVTK